MAEAVEKHSKEGVGDFIRKTREEMGRTTFPSGDEVRKTTIIVVINVLFVALYWFLVDRGWVYILEALEWVINKIAGV